MNQPGADDSLKQETEISLKEMIIKIGKFKDQLLFRWKIILLVGAVCGLLGVAYAYIKKPRYTAVLTFALEDEKSGGIGGALGLASQFGFDLGGSGGGVFAGDNLIELLKSRSMVEKALLTTVVINGKKQTLAERYMAFNGYRNDWKDEPGLKDISFLPNAQRANFTLKQDSVLGVFYDDIIKANLGVDKVNKKLSIVTVSVTSKDELFSKYFVEVLTGTVSDFYVQTKTKKSAQNSRILQHQTDSVRRELNAAIGGVATSIDATPNQNPARQILRAPSQRRQVDVQANQAILTELVKNLEISKVTLRKETPLIQVIDSPILPLSKSKVGKVSAGVIGFLIGSFLAIFCLSAKLLYKSAMS